MCGCSRYILVLLSLLFFFAGIGLMGVGTYALVHEVIFGEHFLTQFFESVNEPFPEELQERISSYFLILSITCISLGVILFGAGINGLAGACQRFKVTTKYGVRRSSMPCFVFFILIILACSGLIAAYALYVGTSDGRKAGGDMIAATKSPDFKLNWKVLDLQETANQLLHDLSEFVRRTSSQSGKGDSDNVVRNALFLTGGVMCTVSVLIVLWLIVACCFWCGSTTVNEDYAYVSPEQKSYDDWITRDEKRAY